MAIVIAPALSMQASGNLGSINYTQFKGRNVARTKYVTTQPNTPAQQVAQGYLALSLAAWQDMSQADRDIWISYARMETRIDRLGQKYIPNAYQVFMGMATQAQLAGYSIPSLPPVEKFKYAIIELQVYQLMTDPGFIYVKPITLPIGHSTGKVQYWATSGWASDGRQPQIKDFDLKITGTPSLYWRSSGYTDTFNYFFRCRVIDSYGRRSNFLINGIKFEA